MSQQPNIVFIQADQLSARQLHMYGFPVDSSPTLDRMANEGRRYDRHYVTFPICLPHRATVLTGRTPGVHGQIGGSTVLLGDNPSYAHVLRRQGYHCGGWGKFHREGTNAPHPRTLEDLGFHEWKIVEDDKRGPYLDWIRQEHPEYYELALGRLGKWKGHLDEEELAMRERARAEVFRPLQNQTHYSHMFPSPFPEEVHDTTWITNLGLDYMQRRLDADDAQPFFCQISYVDPHDPYDPPKPYQDMYTPDDMPEPVAAEWEEQGPSCLREFNALNCKVIREQNPAIFRQARALYHGSIRFMDDQIARVIDFLEKRGIADHTIVVFSTDHGDMMGDHGFMAKGHPHYDGCIRSPLIVWGGGVSGGPCDQLTCALDFFPTFCEWAGVPADELPPLEGKSFAGSAQGGQDPDTWREVSLTSIGSQSVVTDDGWRLTRYLEHDQGQMFHLFDDPDEQRNLYEDGSLGDKRQELLERCIRIESRPYQIPSYRTSNPRRREIDYLQYQNDR